jgi:hypothetical protein
LPLVGYWNTASTLPAQIAPAPVGLFLIQTPEQILKTVASEMAVFADLHTIRSVSQ